MNGSEPSAEILVQEKREKDSIRQHRLGYFLHNLLVKKIFSKVSNKSQKKLINLISGHPQSILDVSCGDDDFIIQLYRKFKARVCVANDLSPQLTSFINDSNADVTFTNFNILSQPFVKKFDLVICKNTLHHIPRRHQSGLIRYLLSISRQLLLVDVENPRLSIRARIWNWYYRVFLGDKGSTFLDFKDFKSLLATSESLFVVGNVATSKGNYMYGVYLENKDNSDSNRL